MIQTDDWQIAQDWLTILTSVEGVVAKRADGHYVAGRQRSWIKVKRQRTIDCVVIGIAGDEHSRKLVLALTHGDGELHHLGVTHPLAPDLLAPVADGLAQALSVARLRVVIVTGLALGLSATGAGLGVRALNVTRPAPTRPEQPPDVPPTLACPSCGVPMQYRGTSKQVAGSQYRDDLFVCPNCKTRILRPRKG